MDINIDVDVDGELARERERELVSSGRHEGAGVDKWAFVGVGVFVLFQYFVRKVVCATVMYRSGSGQPKR